MSTYTDKFFADKAVGALWDVAVSIKRGNPLPLDKDSVVHGLTELNAIATGSVSYPGQIIAVIEDAVYEEDVLVKEESTTLYYLDHNKTPKEVGKVPTGDGKTIEVSAEGAISLIGAAGAENGTLPMMENGSLTWKTLEDIGAGDGNDDTTYQFSFADQKITIKPLFNGQPIKAEEGEKADAEGNLIQELDLSVFVTNDELTATLADYYTKDEIDEAIEAIDFIDTDELATALTPYAKTADVNTAIDNAVKGILGEDVDAAYDTLKEIQDILTGTDGEAIDGVIEGIAANKAAIEAEVTRATGAETALGQRIDGIEETIEGLDDANTTYELSGNGVTVTLTPSEGDATSVTLDAYTKGETDSKIDEKIASVTGGESAADVKLALESYRNALNTEIWGTDAANWTTTSTDEDGKTIVTYIPQYGNTSRVDALETKVKALEDVGAQANVIEQVKASNTAKLTITTEDKVVTVDDADLQASIVEAKKAGTDAKSALETYKGANDAAVEQVATDLATEAQKVTNLTTTVGNQGTQITNLEALTSGHASTIASHTTSISNLTGELAITAKQTDLDAAVARIVVNENAIKAINETTIPGLVDALGSKAESKDVYNKTEIGTIEEDKTLVEMIEEAKSEATYDDTEVRGLIAAIYNKADENTTATGVLVDEIARIEGLIAAEADRATGIEEDHEDRIAKMEVFWEAADDPEGTIDKLAEIVAYIENDKSGALDMAEAIANNTEAIADIYTPGDGEIPASGILVTEIARVEKKADDNANAIAAINHPTTGILALANKHTDDAIAALLVKGVDNKTIKLDDEGKAYVNEVSTDLLVQGDQELILNGGSATA